jgi:hypothetical protein
MAAQSWTSAAALLAEAEDMCQDVKSEPVRLVPVVMAPPSLPPPPLAPAAPAAPAAVVEEMRVQPSFHSQGVLGCKHDVKTAKLLAPCCNRWFVCRRCHDEAVTDHVMDRYNVQSVWCMRCGEMQPFSQMCVKCKHPFASSSCKECRLLTSKQVFHCFSCGVCRVGSGADYVHCGTCGVCIEKKNVARHQCIPGSHNGNCPICFETMNARECNDVSFLDGVVCWFVSCLPLQPVVFSLCGHPMHEACLRSYIEHNHFKCPLCSKLLGDMTRQFAELRQLILAQPMPPA